jgi:hypothetical protein
VNVFDGNSGDIGRSLTLQNSGRRQSADANPDDVMGLCRDELTELFQL